MSVADVAKLHSVVDASIAPNGEWIAYRQAVPRDPLKDADGSSWVELHVSDLNGHSRPYVTGKLNVGTMAWSPDSQRIYYLARRHDDSSTSLYCIPLNGGESRRVLTHATGIGDFAISPDGTQVAFLATEEMDESVKKLKDQGFNQEIYEEDLRPTRVWLAELSEDAKSRMLDIAGSAHDIGWNPARSELYVVTSPTPTVDDSYMFKQIKIVDVRTGHELSSVLSPGKLGQVEWSPDGRRLAMIAGSDLYDPQEGRLKVIAVPGPQEPIDLMPDDEAHVASFVWQDDKTLLWIADDRQYTTLGRVTMRDEGTADERQVLVEGPGPVMSSLSLADQGGVACVLGNTAQHPNEVFRLNVDEPSLHRLTNSNDGLSKIKFAEQSVVKWQARDGMEIEGVLIKPLEYVEGRRYPMIMVVHGGPESHVADGWVTNYSNPGQVGAARGFAVFYPNYRGSTGRGVEFSKLGQADAAGKEFDDLVDGVDHLIETGLVERNRVGITGGSYGGYASAWGATYYSERFAASVMFVGISNNVSKLGTTDIPEEMYLVHHRKRLWDDVNYFLDRSPIRYVERHRTPTLILHGKQDPRVHPSQSLELFRHLKTLDQAPVRLVLYEGEGHGNRRATSRLDYQLRQLRWMEHYLIGPGGKAPPMELDYEAALSK
jgi:dipeptidyl aminopeptidase/acylaminoacyl peptidase